MNNKLIINTNLLRKESEFSAKACVVEKAIAVSHTEFDDLKRHPLQDNDLKVIYIIDISLALFLSKYAVFIYNLHAMILIFIFSTTVIFFLAPIENPNKPLSESEAVNNARKSKVLSVILCLTIIVLYRINKGISLTLLLTYFSAAAAMIIEYLRKGGTVHEDQKENG